MAVSSEMIDQRIGKVQQFLEEEDLGALFVYSPAMEHMWGQTGHVAYLSGWADHDRIVDSAVVVPRVGEAALMFAGMPYMRDLAMEVSPLDDVRLVTAVDPNAVAVDARKPGAPRSFAAETLAILDESGFGDRQVGVVGIDNMPQPFHQALVGELGARFAAPRDIVAELRYAKTPDEVGMMRRAAALSDLGFETLVKTARPGMRGIEVVAEMERVIRRQGADVAKYWIASGPAPDWSDVRLEVKPHMRVLEAGDLMAACSYVVYKGYWCHGQRTGSLGEPCPELERICALTREAQDAGLEGDEAGRSRGRRRQGGAGEGGRERLGDPGRPHRPRHGPRLQREPGAQREQRDPAAGRNHRGRALDLLAARVGEDVRPPRGRLPRDGKRSRVPDVVSARAVRRRCLGRQRNCGAFSIDQFDALFMVVYVCSLSFTVSSIWHSHGEVIQHVVPSGTKLFAYNSR